MRVMAIMDWWVLFLDFLTQSVVENGVQTKDGDTSLEIPKDIGIVNRTELEGKKPFEIKLNITDSEIVVVEDASVLETIAIILRVSSQF